MLLASILRNGSGLRRCSSTGSQRPYACEETRVTTQRTNCQMLASCPHPPCLRGGIGYRPVMSAGVSLPKRPPAAAGPSPRGRPVTPCRRHVAAPGTARESVSTHNEATRSAWPARDR